MWGIDGGGIISVALHSLQRWSKRGKGSGSVFPHDRIICGLMLTFLLFAIGFDYFRERLFILVGLLFKLCV